MANMICPYCQKEFPGDYKWCMDDGSELEQNLGQYSESTEQGTKVPCPECGSPVDTRDLFCGNCAARIEGRLPQPKEPEYDEASDYVEPPEPAYVPPTPAPPVRKPAAPVPIPAPVMAPRVEPVSEEPGPMRPCPRCGGDVGLSDTVCGVCGAELESVIPAASFDGLIHGRVCKYCSAGLEPEDTYCGACGHSVEPEVAPAGPEICRSCGMEIMPGDAFCGTCGNPVQKHAASSEQAEAPAAGVAASGAAAVVCSSCGMDIAPGDTFCGTCGNPVGEQKVSRPAAAAPAGGKSEQDKTIVAPFSAMRTCPSCGVDVTSDEEVCGTCGHTMKEYDEPEVIDIGAPVAPAPVQRPPQVAASTPTSGSTALSCPNCGMDIESGDTFCGTCGFSFAAGSQDASPEPARPSVASIADVMSAIPVCPSCGIEGEQGQTTCLACGSSLTVDGALEPGAPDSIRDYEETPLQEEDYTNGATEPVELTAPAAASATGSIASPAAAASPSGEKVCSCCGSASPADSKFCGNCGVDFD